MTSSLSSTASSSFSSLLSSSSSSQVKDWTTELDLRITDLDRKFLQDDDLARQLAELGYIGSNPDPPNREEFERKNKELEAAKSKSSIKVSKKLCSAGGDYSNAPLLRELAEREEAVASGKQTVSHYMLRTIIFIRDRNSKGHEISGYIDYAHRLKREDFTPIFNGQRKLLPKPSDLSYYNWDTQMCTSNHTANFQVKAENGEGLLFKNKRDRKVINVNAKANIGDNSERHEVTDPEYIQIVIFDHTTRRRV